jgi:N-acetylglucosamine-6-phosphate deacetylase
MPSLLLHGGSTDVLIADGTIADVGPTATGGDELLDASACTVAAGFIDLQCNGGHGIDLAAEPERLWELAALLPQHGVTAWLPTIVSTPPDIVERALHAWARRPVGFVGAEPIGLHLEGPALNPLRRGAHPVGLLRLPTAELVGGWRRDQGVALVTLAPELTGGIEAVRALRDAGVVVAAGHTDATTDEILAALDAGVTMTTHLFNGMVPFAHREPGPVGLTLADARITAGLIADGVHVHPIAVAAAYAALGDERLALVTDAVAPMGLPGAADAARLADGTLAGSTLTMDAAVRNLIAFAGAAPEAALRSASQTPARVLADSGRGELEIGRRADVVVLDRALRVMTTVVGGVVAYRRT